MKKFFLFIIQISFALSFFAQDISFDVKSTGPLSDRLKSRTFDTRAIGSDNNFTYFLCYPYRSLNNEIAIGLTADFFITKCDNTPKVISKKLINLDYHGKDRAFEGISLLNSKLLVFTSFQNLKYKKHYLFVQNINKESLSPEDSLKLIGEIDYSAYSKYLKTNILWSFSEDKSKILVFYSLINKGHEILKYGMYIYDNKFNLIWGNDNLSQQIGEGIFNFQKYSIDNEGNVYILGKVYKNIREYNKLPTYKNAFLSGDSYYTYDPNYLYQLCKFTINTSENATINIPDKFITSLTFSTNSTSKIFCAGLYSSPGMISARGCFTLNIELATGKISNLSTKEFDETFHNNILTEKELQNFRKSVDNNMEWDPYEYLLGNIKTRENGERYLIAEQYISGQKKQISGSRTYIYPTYSFHNLIVINLNKDYKISQLSKIEKHQYSILNDQYSSYFEFEKNNNLYFVFMDIIRKNTFFKNYEFGNTFLVKLETSDKQERVILKNTEKDSKLLFLPRSSATTGQGEIIYSSISDLGRIFQYDRIKVND